MDSESILIGDQRAKLVAHLVREHRWDEWDLTEFFAIPDLHAELHEQVPVDHYHADGGGFAPR